MELAKTSLFSIEEWENEINTESSSKTYFYNGEIISMAPTGWDHGEIQSKLSELLAPYRYNKKSHGGPPFGTHFCWKFISEASVKYLDGKYGFIHDLAGWKMQNWQQPTIKSAISSAPDWVCEILSPSNSSKDFVDVKQALLLAKVPFYWIVDISRKRIICYSLENNYSIGEEFKTENKSVVIIPPFPLELNLENLFDLA